MLNEKNETRDVLKGRAACCLNTGKEKNCDSACMQFTNALAGGKYCS